MKKIKHFTEDQIQHIREIFPDECKHLKNYSGKEKCPVCKKWFRRLPKKETFKKLVSIYDATDLAWSEVFVTDRASVTNLRKKYKLGSYNLDEIWNEKRYLEESKIFLDKQPILDFFNLLRKYPRADEPSLLKIAEINKNYLELVISFNTDLYEEYQISKRIRNSKNQNIDYSFCIKCQIKKKFENFKFIKDSENVLSKICNLCAAENIKNFRDAENYARVKCQKCGKKYNKSSLRENELQQSICANCQNLISKSKMKLGVNENDDTSNWN